MSYHFINNQAQQSSIVMTMAVTFRWSSSIVEPIVDYASADFPPQHVSPDD